MGFYNCLNYSLGNEDWHVEAQGLRPGAHDHAVCVTASGDRSLHFLMTDCAQVTSIDMNPVQNHLLDLKLAAIKKLDFEKYLDFLGLNSTTHRQAIFNELKSELTSKETLDFWENHQGMIKKGVIYQGKTERLTHFGGKFIQLFRPHLTDLFSFTDINEQREYLNQKWDTTIWRHLIQMLIGSKLIKFILRDPGLTKAELAITPGEYVYSRMIHYLQENLARKSPMLQLIFTGRLLPEAYFPYLTWEGFSRIQKNPGRLKYETGNIVDFLNTHEPNQFDCFSMSDIASYMPQSAFEQLLNGIIHSAKPNARFCLREFMSLRHVPSHLKPILKRAPVLEKKLEKEESNFVYRFIAGEVDKK